MRPEWIRLFKTGMWLGIALGLVLFLLGKCAEVW